MRNPGTKKPAPSGRFVELSERSDSRCSSGYSGCLGETAASRDVRISNPIAACDSAARLRAGGVQCGLQLAPDRLGLFVELSTADVENARMGDRILSERETCGARETGLAGAERR